MCRSPSGHHSTARQGEPHPLNGVNPAVHPSREPSGLGNHQLRMTISSDKAASSGPGLGWRRGYPIMTRSAARTSGGKYLHQGDAPGSRAGHDDDQEPSEDGDMSDDGRRGTDCRSRNSFTHAQVADVVSDAYRVRWMGRQAVIALPEHINVSNAGRTRKEWGWSTTAAAADGRRDGHGRVRPFLRGRRHPCVPSVPSPAARSCGWSSAPRSSGMHLASTDSIG